MATSYFSKWSFWYGIPVLLALVFLVVTGYSGLNGQDAHDYLHISKAYSNWFGGGERPMMVEHPHGFPFMGAVLALVVGSELVALRILCSAALVVIVFFLRGILIRAFEHDQKVDAFVLLGCALSPFLLRYALITLSDLPAIALMVIAFGSTCRWVDPGKPGWLLSAVLFSVLAITVRSAVVAVVCILALAWVFGPQKGRRIRLMIGLFGMAAGVIALLVWLTPHRMAGIHALGPLEDLSFMNLFRRELVSDDGVLTYRLPNLFYVLSIVIHPGFVPIGILLIPFFRKADLRYTHAKLALAIPLGYVLFVGCMPFQNDRVLLMAQPFVVVLFFPAFKRACEFVELKGISMKWVMVAVVLVQSALFIRATIPFAQQAKVEQELAVKVNSLAPKRVYTHGMGAAFRTYCPSVEVTELWYTELDEFDHGALIVVHEQRLAGQWQGRAPYINWKRAEAQGIDLVEIRRDGWSISRVR